MNVKYSKEFEKSVRALSGKVLESVRNCIAEVKAAQNIYEISDCVKMQDYKNIYRIRIGSLRAFFVFHIEITDNTVFFKYLVPRVQAYAKRAKEKLKKADQD